MSSFEERNIDEEGVVALLSEITKDLLVFTLRTYEGEALPHICTARKMGAQKIFVFIEETGNSASCFLYEETSDQLIDNLTSIVAEVLYLVEKV